MKKMFLMATVAAGLLSSCSQDDLDMSSPLDSNTIVFSTRQNQMQTRSASTVSALDKFYVTSVNSDNTSYFNEEEFVYKEASSSFVSQTPHYWPVSGTLSFYAVNEKGSLAFGSNAVPSYTYENWAATTDLVAATVKAGTKQMPYPLTFKHLTSQIRISAESENKTEQLTYKLTAVRMSAPAKGVYSFADVTGGVGSWNIDKKSSKTYDYSEGIGTGLTCDNNGSITLNSTYWNILPATDGSLDFEVEYEVYQNGKVIADFTGEKAKKCSISTPNLSAGKQYTYNFILALGSEDVITFTTTVGDWNDNTTSNLTPVTVIAESNAIDLGLSVKWAQGNLGAEKEIDTGLFYAWGETTGYAPDSGHEFTSANYNPPSGVELLPLQYDAAHVRLGGNWRMPTYAELRELTDDTDNYMTTINGVVGYKFVNKTDATKYIFLPFCHLDVNGNKMGHYWSSTCTAGVVVSYLNVFDSSTYLDGNFFSYYGFSIRAVRE